MPTGASLAGLAVSFLWDESLLPKVEEEFLVGSGIVAGWVKHLDVAEREQFTVEAMSTEAVTTSEIEGEVLDRVSVQSSIRKALGLATDNRRVRPAEAGIAEVMTDLYRSFGEPLSEEMLFTWHGKNAQRPQGLERCRALPQERRADADRVPRSR